MRSKAITAAACALLAGGLAACGVDEVGHVRDAGALGPYSGAVVSEDLVFLSGKIGERGGSFEHEVMTAIDAVERGLADAGASLGDVLSVTAFLTGMELYGEFNDIYGRRMEQPYPARTTVAVSALPGGARVELQVIARVP